MESVLKFLPKVRGQYKEHAPLANFSWFKVGGPADVLFLPADTNDLSNFLINKPAKLELNILGLCSNIIIRDKGVSGCVVKLGKGFREIVVEKGRSVKVGCGLDNYHLVSFLLEQGLTGLEFLSGVPGSVGGAVVMNAGCCGSEVKEFLISVEAVNKKTGKIIQISVKDLSLEYRHNGMANDFIFTNATFLLDFEKDQNKMRENIKKISKMKLASQPIGEKTGGSIFKNPDPKMCKYKAWELIDRTGFRGYVFGGAKISEKHTNFLINTGKATAKELEGLGELVRTKVKEKFDINLEWEIKRIGRI